MNSYTYTGYEQYISRQAIHPLSPRNHTDTAHLSSSSREYPYITTIPYRSDFEPTIASSSIKDGNNRKGDMNQINGGFSRFPTFVTPYTAKLIHSERYEHSESTKFQVSEEDAKKKKRKLQSSFAFNNNRVSETIDANLKEEEQRARLKNLEKNRLAASRCRQRRKEWVDELARKAERMTRENEHLRQLLAQLREETIHLRAQLLMHERDSCNKKGFNPSLF